jgi:hypothetical protein
MKMKIKLIIFLFCVTITLSAQETTYKDVVIDDISYTLFTDSLTGQRCAHVGNLKKSFTNLKVPASVKYEGKKYTVTAVWTLGSYAADLVSVQLPKTIKEIHGAFFMCTKLKDINIPESVETIYNISFYNTAIENLILPEGLKTIGNDAFGNCKYLVSVRFPKSLTSIGKTAFKDCISLKNVNLPGSLIDIKGGYDGTFTGCTALTSVTVEEGIKEIANGMFKKCTSLSTISLPQSVERIGNNAFEGCTSLKQVSFKRLSEIQEIGNQAFSDCKSLIEVGSHTSLKRIGYRAFDNCNSLIEFNLFNGIDSIPDYSFANCSSLKNILGSNIKYIGDFAFYKCESLNSADFESVERIDYHAFSNCESLEYLSCPNIKYIEKGNFFLNKKLKYITGLTSKVELGERLDIMFRYTQVDTIPLARSYKYYSTNRLKEAIGTWQERKKYETIAQWRKRVTLETRKQKYDELKDLIRNDYINAYKPNPIKCKIESYDADLGIFKLKAENINTYELWSKEDLRNYTYTIGEPRYVYAKVPANEAEAFEKNWDKVILKPTYCITKDYLDVASCTFTLNGKTYKSPVLYDDETADLNIELPPLDLDLLNSANQDMAAVKDKTIDENIPTNGTINEKTFVVIIGNENYKQVARVPYALNDAIIFKDYCKKTLGVPNKNIRSYPDATYAMMLSSLKDIQNIAEAYKGDINVIFYYAGHGVPNEKDQTTYLLPTDADGSQTDICMSVSRLYKGLAEMKAKNVTVFMDACFSGSQRGEGMITSARGVAIKAKEAAPQGNMVIFTAASGDETAYPYKEKGHGMFTYFLLKKLRDTKGDVTLGELGQYITDNVRQQSVVVNRRVQTPTVMPARSLGDGWKNIKLK